MPRQGNVVITISNLSLSQAQELQTYLDTVRKTQAPNTDIVYSKGVAQQLSRATL